MKVQISKYAICVFIDHEMIDKYCLRSLWYLSTLALTQQL